MMVFIFSILTGNYMKRLRDVKKIHENNEATKEETLVTIYFDPT